MKIWSRLFLAVCLLPAVSTAQVADTYKLQAGQPTGIVSRVAIDIIGHGIDSTGVWLATGRGVNYTFDGGTTWFSIGAADGLPSENLSAIFSIDDRLWVASNHDEYIAGALRMLSDGLTYSDDDGANWTRVNFGPDGLNIPFVWGGDRPIFDITGHTDLGFMNNRLLSSDVNWLFFTAKAGGLLASQDGGENWRRIYPSPGDSIQFNLTSQAPSLRNRYFSCVTDTSHGDSLILWAGSAGGIFQYVYVPPRQKLYSHLVNGVAFCDTCLEPGGSVLFIGGENGLSRTMTTGGQFTTSFEIDGLPGKTVTALINIGEYLLVGTADSADGTSTGLAVSTDGGDSFVSVVLPDVVGPDRHISDFAVMDDRLYMAAQQAGLFVSSDSGQTWTHILVDSANSLAATNFTNAVGVLSDTLLVGTDSGYAELRLDAAGDIISSFHKPFIEDDSSSARIIRVRAQRFENDTLPGVYDSTVIWTVHHPVTSSGTPIVGRSRWVIDTLPPDTSLQSLHYQVQAVSYDVNFFGDTAFVVGEEGIRFTTRGTNPSNIFSARQYVNDTLVVATLDDDTVTTMSIRSDTIVFGTFNGLAISDDQGQSFRIFRANTDTLAADFVVNHSFLTSLGGLTGDFIPVLAVQYPVGDPARVWASSRPTDVGVNGIAVGEFRTITNASGDSIGYGLVWQKVLDREFAWNFEFVGDSVFAATSSGLLLHNGSRDLDGKFVLDWETVPLTDAATGEVLVPPGTPVFGIEVVDSFLWVGTDDGTVRIRLDDLGSQQLFMRVDETTPPDEVYAFPVPFRPNLGQELDFRFVVETAGNVTLEIYDFAMNLVARPIDDVFYPAGTYPNGSSQGVTWDGRNDRGDVVAVGVYYFKVEQASGDVRWGKLAVMP